MFYRPEGSLSPLSLVQDVSAVVAASLDLAKELDLFVITVLPPSHIDLQSQFGLLALLQLIIDADGAHRSTLLPIVLSSLSSLTKVCDKAADFEMSHEYIQLENFIYEAFVKLLLIAQKFEDSRDEIMPTIWTWSKKFADSLNKNYPSEQLFSIVASSVGTVCAFGDSFAPLHLPYLPQIKSVIQQILSEETIILIHNAAASHDATTKLPTYTEQGFDNLSLVADLITFMRQLVGGLIDASELSVGPEEKNIWETVMKGKAKTRLTVKQSAGEEGEAIKTIYNLCWDMNWKQALRDTSFENDPQTFETMLSVIVQTAVLCTFHIESLAETTIQNLCDVLEDAESVFGNPVSMETYLTVIEGLGILCNQHSTYRTKILDILTGILIKPSSIFFTTTEESALTSARQCASSVFCTCLQIVNDSSATKSRLFTFINAAQSIYSSLDSDPANPKYVVYLNAITAIAAITPVLKPHEAIEIAIPVIARKLEDPNPKAEKLLWDSLGNIGLTCADDAVFREIVSFVLQHSKKTFSKVSRTSHTLARMSGRPLKFYKIYLDCVLSMFVDRAAGLLKNAGDPVLLSELRELANLVRIICDRPDFHIITPTESSENQEFFSLFRNFWLYAVIYILSPSGHWPRDWNVMLTSIAAKTPPLLLAGTTRTLEAELGSHSILRGKFTESTVAKIKATLVSLLPAVSNESKNLTFFQSAYLLAVYQIESLRVKRTSTMYVSEYLKDEKLYGTEIYGLLEAIAEDITKTFTRDKLVGNPSGPEIESHMELLILDAAHRLGRVRKFGSRTINSILKSVPAVLWNSKLVSFLFDVLQYLDGVGNKKRGSRKSNILQKEIKFVNDQDAVGARQDYYDLALGWIYAANKRCNSDTNGLIARYLVEVDIKFPDLTGSKNSLLTKLINKFYSHPDTDITVTRALGRSALYTGEVRGMVSIMTKLTGQSINVSERNVSEQIQNELQEMLEFAGMKVLPSESLQQLNKLLNRGAALIISSDEVDEELLHRICWTPVILFSPAVLDIAVPVWSWIMTSRPDLALGLLSDLVTCWEHTILHRHGIYSEEKRSLNAFMNKMSYTPSSVPDDSEDPAKAHETWTNFLADRFRVARHQGLEYTKIYVKLLQMTGEHCGNARCSPAVREARWKCLNMGLKVVLDMEAKNNPFAPIVRYFIYEDVFQWFSGSPSWGWSRTELSLLHEFYSALKVSRLDKVNKMVNGWQLKALKIAFTASNPAGRVDIEEAHQVLLLLLENEMSRLATWHDPMDEKLQEVANLPSTTLEKTVKWPSIVRTAWAINPKMALQLRHRFIVPLTPDIIDRELSEIAATDALSISEYVEGLPMIMNQGQSNTNTILRTILYWAPATPIIAIALLGPNSKPHPWVLQFSTRSLEQYPIEQVFFYIPQMVQALRYDTGGYVEHFILNAAKSSQLFAHQIIWNMKANMYKEGEGKGADKVEDPLKPTLEKIIDKIVGALSGSDKEFYEREFKFFGEVTEISGKLKPYIHKSKAEKKKKIDEEIRKISVDVGVYLPSNPESIVVDIDYDSGRPLQSHAKAPFMATFKIKQAGETGHTGSAENLTSKTEWQSAIFKVGDDCRQDVLALQLVSIFKSIFTAVGADMYLFPYRVVATAPGCGVIEVIPRSISRDMMGREKVNDLFLYYIARFGRVESMGYKKAQNAFVKSLAAYSILLYILQIKDRHNGNIMFDDDGHIVHIDFGFILDIVPGGVKFEASPFKLTTEMVDVMGGANSSSYQLLCQKIVQAYLAIRPYAEEIIHMVGLMMDSCLPCFKDATLKNLRDRFQLQLSERAAADFMIARIRESHENTFSVLYDEFQKLQNGIPYRA